MSKEPEATEQRSGADPSSTDSSTPAKPPILWMLLPIVLIAIAVYLAR